MAQKSDGTARSNKLFSRRMNASGWSSVWYYGIAEFPANIRTHTQYTHIQLFLKDALIFCFIKPLKPFGVVFPCGVFSLNS